MPRAQERDRTADLVLTKDVLCRLSYLGTSTTRPNRSVFKRMQAAPSTASHHFFADRDAGRLPGSAQVQGATQQMGACRQPAPERETGFEPATLSLEG
jgi:hypothetical protein